MNPRNGEEEESSEAENQLKRLVPPSQGSDFLQIKGKAGLLKWPRTSKERPLRYSFKTAGLEGDPESDEIDHAMIQNCCAIHNATC